MVPHFRDNCKDQLKLSNVPEEPLKDFLFDLFGRRIGDKLEKGKFRIVIIIIGLIIIMTATAIVAKSILVPWTVCVHLKLYAFSGKLTENYWVPPSPYQH